ncbi:MAG: hypothetical protein ACI4RM_06295 [Ruminococcus sp.]
MKKIYVSPSAEYLEIELIEDVLTGSNPAGGFDVDVHPDESNPIEKGTIDVGDGGDFWG